jgi:flagellar export protein FliJ
MGGNSGEKLSQISDYIKGIEIKIERQKIVIRKQLAIVEERQRALQEASIEYKMVDKLKERQQSAYRDNEKKLEQKDQNEIANSRFEVRRKNEQ